MHLAAYRSALLRETTTKHSSCTRPAMQGSGKHAALLHYTSMIAYTVDGSSSACTKQTFLIEIHIF